MWQSSRLLDRANLLLAQLLARESEKYRRPPTWRSEAHLFQRFEIALEILGATPVHTDFPGHAGISKCVEIDIGQARGLVQSKTLRLITNGRQSPPARPGQSSRGVSGHRREHAGPTSVFPLCGIIHRGRHSRKTETSRRTSNSQIKARMAAKFGSFVKPHRR